MNNEVLEQLKQEYKEALKRMQDIGEIIANCEDIDTSHCGQDAKEEDQTIPRLRHDVLGKEVICVGGNKSRCVKCPHDENGDDCVKLELLNGTYICLAKPQQDKQPVISFDEEESNVMDDIKEKTEDFLNYLDSIFNTKEQ
jgi:hypothetical protein